MKKTFKLDGLCCANCASKIERDINKIKGVENATVNAITAKLIIELLDGFDIDDIISKAEKAIHKHEPKVVLY